MNTILVGAQWGDEGKGKIIDVLTEQADVVLPSKIWYEKQGHITNFEGKRMMLTRSVDAPSDILSDWATMFMLSVKMGRPLTCITVADSLSGLV